MTDPAAPRPTRVRHWIVLIAMFAAVLLYLERVCLSVAEVFIREDLRIGKDRMDLVLGAFFIAYALGQVPSGWLSQRYGPRLMMTLYMVGWSVFGVFIALAQDFYTLIAARFLLGLSQAGAYPTAALLVKRWVPDRARGTASGIVAFGGRFGGAGANWLTGVLIVAFVPITVPATVAPADVLDMEPFHKVWALRINWANPSVSDKDIMDMETLRLRLAQRLWAVGNSAPLDGQRFADELNSLIRDPRLSANLDRTSVPLAVDGQAILSKRPEDRTEAEVKRLNRLLIEKAFPGAIRQLHVEGWRPTLLLYGVAGVVVGLFFWVVARDWPRGHPWANAAEVNHIESGQSAAAQTAGTDAIPWRELLASRNQWLYSLTQVFSNIGWVFLITLMPRFLDERFGVPVDQRGLMTTIPLFVAALFLPVAGWFTDRLRREYGVRWGRAIPMGAFKFPCAVALLTSVYLPDAWAVVAALTFMSVCQDFGIPATWAFAQDTGGKQVGAVLGWANMWGNLGAGVAPILMRQIFKAYDVPGTNAGWDAVLVAGAWAFLLCGICGMLTNAAQPLFRDEREERRGE